jgi:hypothetical protein
MFSAQQELTVCPSCEFVTPNIRFPGWAQNHEASKLTQQNYTKSCNSCQSQLSHRWCYSGDPLFSWIFAGIHPLKAYETKDGCSRCLRCVQRGMQRQAALLPQMKRIYLSTLSRGWLLGVHKTVLQTSTVVHTYYPFFLLPFDGIAVAFWFFRTDSSD